MYLYPDVSVIIVNFNTTNLIIDCLTSLFNLTKEITFEIIVVDNASEPDFDKRISSSFPKETDKLKFIHLPENIGFGRANNKGIEIALGRNIFFLNPDTILINNAIKILSNFLDSNKKVGACGANLLSEEMTPNLSFRRILPGIRWEINELLNNFPQRLRHGKRALYETYDKPTQVGYITGADLMIKNEILSQGDAFSPEFFMYYEETDLCARIKKSGWKIYCVPTAIIQHLDGKSFDNSAPVNYKKIDFQEKGRAIYYLLNTSPTKKFFADIIYGIYLLSRKILLHKGNKQEGYCARWKSFIKYRRLLLSDLQNHNK